MIRNTVICLLICFLCQSNAIAETKQASPEAKKQAALLRQMISPEGLFGAIKPSSTPVNDAIDPTPLPTDVSEGEVKSALGVFSKAFYLRLKNIFSENSAEIEFDKFLLPNYSAATITTQWSSLKSKKGIELIDASEREKQSLGTGNASEISLKNFDETDPLYEAKGKSAVKFPVKFLRIDVSISDLKKPILKGDYEFILQALNNDYSLIQINNKEGLDLTNKGILVIPIGKDGRLNVTESSESPTSIEIPPFVTKAIEDLENGKKTVEEVNAELSKNQKELENIGKRSERIFTTKAIGTINSLAVFIPEEFVNETIDVTAITAPEINQKQIENFRGNRFLNHRKANFQNMTLDELKKNIQCKSDRSSALFGYNTPEVVCFFPKISNSEYVSVELKDPVLWDKANKPVPYKLETIGYNSETYSVEMRFKHKNNDSIITFEKVTGTVHIRYPIKIKTIQIKKSELKETELKETELKEAEVKEADISIDGYFVKYNEKKLNTAFGSIPTINPVRAFDNEGRELFKLNYLTHEGDFETTAFWGYPETAEMDTIIEWVEFDLKYDLAPAKLLDKAKISFGSL